MNRVTRPAAGLSALVLAATPFLLTPDTAAADSHSKASIEHAERQAVAATTPSKAQIERSERAQREQSPGGTTRIDPPSAPDPASGGSGAAAWQLALSAALGATVAGGVLVAARQASSHRHVIAH